MRDLLTFLFGAEKADTALVVTHNGEDMVSVRHICDFIGIQNEYHAVEDQHRIPEFNLTDEEKRKIWTPGVHRKCPVWFVTKSGVQKILERSQSPGAQTFRIRVMEQLMLNAVRR